MSDADTGDDYWLIAEGEEDGNQLIFRAKEAIPPEVAVKDYPLLISVYWAYESQETGGMPDEDTNLDQLELEQALAPLDTPEFSYLMLVIVGGGKKEWHYYAAQEEAWINQLNELLKDYPEYPLQIEISDDPEWSLYTDFLEGVQGRPEGSEDSE